MNQHRLPPVIPEMINLTSHQRNGDIVQQLVLAQPEYTLISSTQSIYDSHFTRSALSRAHEAPSPSTKAEHSRASPYHAHFTQTVRSSSPLHYTYNSPRLIQLNIKLAHQMRNRKVYFAPRQARNTRQVNIPREHEKEKLTSCQGKSWGHGRTPPGVYLVPPSLTASSVRV